MAGLEQLEVHSKACLADTGEAQKRVLTTGQSYIVRWVKVEEDQTISWSVQPHKKSLNFGIVKHPGLAISLVPTSSKNSQISANDEPTTLPPPEPGFESEKKRRPSNANSKNELQSTAQEQLRSKGFTITRWIGKCDAEKVSAGTCSIETGQGGMYGLVFDNTFSKTTSKTATFVLLTFPTSTPPRSLHHPHNSHAQPSAMASALSGQGMAQSPRMSIFASDSAESLHSQPLAGRGSRSTSVQGRPVDAASSPNHHVGVLQKRRRKKGQGYARRYFSLDYTSCTLSYYYNGKSSALRGAIPLSLAAITADERRREISIDSGAEIWHLRANNLQDFAEWTKALENASNTARGIPNEKDQSAPSKNRASAIYNRMSGIMSDEEREWEQVEALVSRIVGTCDAVRRLAKETKTSSRASTFFGHSASPPADENGDYFSAERKPFWKRKSSAPTVSRLGERAPTSSQLTVPSPSNVFTIHNAGTPSLGRKSKPGQEERGIHEHCTALLKDLDSVLADFHSLITTSKQRRGQARIATSRQSFDSTTTDIFFDAEAGGMDASQVMRINGQSDDDIPDSEMREDFVDDTTSISSGADESITATQLGSLSYFPPKPKSLFPLPVSGHPTRRTTVPAAKVLPPSLIAFLRKNVGKDLSTISMPVSANEPVSLLQRLAENLEYSHLLSTAAQLPNGTQRLLHVTAFAVSNFASGRDRARAMRKPFNPMLGETFELVRGEEEHPGGFRFIAEKICHRPVKLACQADAATWSFSNTQMPTQKFWGKSAEIITEGRVRVVLRLKDGTDECYSWNVAALFLRNVVMGEKYVEPVGSMNVISETTGAKATIEFKSKGMFGGRSEDVSIESYDGNGMHTGVSLVGTWTSSLRIVEAGKAAGAEIWHAGDLIPGSADRYGFTTFAATLNEMSETEAGKCATTDSRLRRDQRAAEEGRLDEAEVWKQKLEEGQRARRAQHESRGSQAAQTPRWFTKVEGSGDENSADEVWKLKVGKDGYWEERAKGTWTNVEDVLNVE